MLRTRTSRQEHGDKKEKWENLLGRLEIAVDYFVRVKIAHALRDLLGVVHHLVGLECHGRAFEIIVKSAVRAELHDNAEEVVAITRESLDPH